MVWGRKKLQVEESSESSNVFSLRIPKTYKTNNKITPINNMLLCFFRPFHFPTGFCRPLNITELSKFEAIVLTLLRRSNRPHILIIEPDLIIILTIIIISYQRLRQRDIQDINTTISTTKNTNTKTRQLI